ncbi:MAG TPA: IS21 family transposase, partial [Streptosporangiaceae bacterium]|nr:IS21 family transposase [Streptosporangiaceae bacterium]
FDGHVRAFAAFGGVPARVRYDNLKPAVVRILRGRDRIESERFVALRSFYGFDSFFCRPGKAGAHEKGGIEGEIGRFRRRHLTPVPTAGSLAELNARLAGADRADDERHVDGRPQTVGAAFAGEQPRLLPLPGEPFDIASLLVARVDSKARVTVRQARYSVPLRYVGRRLAVRLSASAVEVLDGATLVATHERATTKFTDHLVLDHYLEVLKVKPGALPGATALAQARASGAFTDTHQRFWELARRRLGDAAGTSALVEVLLAHRTLPAAALLTALDAAVRDGCVDPQLVVINARRADGEKVAEVVPIGALTRFDRPAPALGGYDQLLAGPTR